jgi:hypothetical protein
MIAHADISVNAAYADRVNADGANSLNLETCCCAKCAEVALHPSKGRFAPEAVGREHLFGRARPLTRYKVIRSR